MIERFGQTVYVHKEGGKVNSGCPNAVLGYFICPASGSSGWLVRIWGTMKATTHYHLRLVDDDAVVAAKLVQSDRLLGQGAGIAGTDMRLQGKLLRGNYAERNQAAGLGGQAPCGEDLVVFDELTGLPARVAPALVDGAPNPAFALRSARAVPPAGGVGVGPLAQPWIRVKPQPCMTLDEVKALDGDRRLAFAPDAGGALQAKCTRFAECRGATTVEEYYRLARVLPTNLWRRASGKKGTITLEQELHDILKSGLARLVLPGRQLSSAAGVVPRVSASHVASVDTPDDPPGAPDAGYGAVTGTLAAAGPAPGTPLLNGTARSARAPSRRRPSGTCTLQGRPTAGGRPRQRRRLSGRGPAGRATSPCKTSATTACTLPVSATGAASSRRRRWWCPTAGTRRRGQPPRCGSAARATSSSPRTSTWRSISLGRGTSAELSPRRVCPGAARGGGARGDRRWRRFSRRR